MFHAPALRQTATNRRCELLSRFPFLRQVCDEQEFKVDDGNDDDGREEESRAKVAAIFKKIDAAREERILARLNRAGSVEATAWLFQNAKAFAEKLAEYHRPNWILLARELYEQAGIKGLAGGPVASETLRMDWYRVRKILAARGVEWARIGPKPVMRAGEGRAKQEKPQRPQPLLVKGELAPGVLLAREPEPVAEPKPVSEAMLRQLRAGSEFRRG